MSRDASITSEWGGEEHVFRLGIAQIEKLQEARDCGPYVLLGRLSGGEWKVEDIREVLRWGLIGGGRSAAEAGKLIKLYFEDTVPAQENLLTAIRVIGAGCVGAPDEPPPGEADAPSPAGNVSTTFPTAS